VEVFKGEDDLDQEYIGIERRRQHIISDLLYPMIIIFFMLTDKNVILSNVKDNFVHGGK
jgi:hypothetical protein